MKDLYYKNDKGEWVHLPEGRSGMFRINGIWVDAQQYITWREYVLNKTCDLENVNGMLLLKDVPPVDENILTEAFTSMYKEKLITPEFLLSKGWKPNRDEFEIRTHTLGFQDTDIFICDEYGFHDGLVYKGPIPTESQYEVLNQLFKFHQ